MNIRNAALDDVYRLIEIYDYYVVNTAITFEYETPTPKVFSDRMKNIIKSYPYLVLEDNGIIQGFAYAGAFHERAAYSRCCELSIYLDNNAKGRGYGRMLYTALENKLKQAGILNLYACIGSTIVEDEYLTNNSEQFHCHLGFTKIGEFHKCGYKFGRWYNMIWMEKFIGQHL